MRYYLSALLILFIITAYVYAKVYDSDFIGDFKSHPLKTEALQTKGIIFLEPERIYNDLENEFSIGFNGEAFYGEIRVFRFTNRDAAVNYIRDIYSSGFKRLDEGGQTGIYEKDNNYILISIDDNWLYTYKVSR